MFRFVPPDLLAQTVYLQHFGRIASDRRVMVSGSYWNTTTLASRLVGSNPIDGAFNEPRGELGNADIGITANRRAVGDKHSGHPPSRFSRYALPLLRVGW